MIFSFENAEKLDIKKLTIAIPKIIYSLTLAMPSIKIRIIIICFTPIFP